MRARSSGVRQIILGCLESAPFWFNNIGGVVFPAILTNSDDLRLGSGQRKHRGDRDNNS